MIEEVELRLFSDQLRRSGIKVPVRENLGSIIVTRLSLNSTIADELLKYDEKLKSRNSCLCVNWQLFRSYSEEEIVRASWFRLSHVYIWTSGDAGWHTTYDESNRCQYCGFGRVQTSPIIVPIKRLPRRDILLLGSNEYLCSRKLVAATATIGCSGPMFLPVFGSIRDARKWVESANRAESDASLELSMLPDSSEAVSPTLLRSAYSPKTALALKDVEWFQLLTSEPDIVLSERISAGTTPLYGVEEALDVCPFGHLRGYRLLSEAITDDGVLDGCLRFSFQRFGQFRGLYAPHREVFATKALAEAWRSEGIRGFEFEILQVVV